MPQVVLVGGPSAIGKSQLVDMVVHEDSRFQRPRSYTTRPARANESSREYEHISLAEFGRLEASGCFVTVDEAYGNYYAMSYSSIQEITESGKVAIKEIHLRYHAKIKQLLPGTVSVLLLPAFPARFWTAIEGGGGPTPDRTDRLKEDREFYECVDARSCSSDIVLTVDPDQPASLLKAAFVDALDRIDMPPATEAELDRRNREGYDLIADEFSDDRRVTTANFHALGEGFFRRQFARYALNCRTALDVGAGRGYLLPMLQEAFPCVVAVDLSTEMLSLIRPTSGHVVTVCGSAYNLPFDDGSFDIVASCLADPFLRRRALTEIQRVLTAGGALVLSTPSRVWADALRKRSKIVPETTEFAHSTGATARVCSFTYSDEELKALVESCGYQLEAFEVAHGKDLRGHNHTVSTALIEAANQLDLGLDDLPILQLIAARKI